MNNFCQHYIVQYIKCININSNRTRTMKNQSNKVNVQNQSRNRSKHKENSEQFLCLSERESCFTFLHFVAQLLYHYVRPSFPFSFQFQQQTELAFLLMVFKMCDILLYCFINFFAVFLFKIKLHLKGHKSNFVIMQSYSIMMCVCVRL